MANFETFIKAYQTASPELKNFIDSEKVGEFVDTLLTNQELQSLKTELLLEMSRFVLGINSESDFIGNLTTVGFSNDFIIANLSTIKEFVASAQTLSPATATSLADTADFPVDKLPNVTGTIPPPSTVTGAVEQPQSEAVYTSTQAAILTEKPTEKFTEGTTWESDN